MDVQSRVVNYYKNNPFIQKYLKGIDSKTGEIVFNYNNEIRRVTIDNLEKISNEENLVALFEGRTVAVSQPVVEEPIIEEPQQSNEVIEENNIEPTKKSLNDIKILVELKNKEGLDNVLKEFAVNSATGLIDVNLAINKVTSNTIREVETSIKDKTNFSQDYNSYDIEGNYIGEKVESNSTPDEKIMKSLQNIYLFFEVAKMYPEQVNYTPEQVENYKNAYINKIKTDLGMNKPVETPNTPSNVEQINNQKNMKNAGFADVLVLTVIVLIYAVIIVNLIIKLK